MAIKIQDILDSRELVTELPESVILSRENILAIVKPAIALWQERTNNNPDKRHPWIVESSDIKITNNVADISDAVDSTGYRLDFIKDGDIVLNTGKTPNCTVKFYKSRDRFENGGRQDKFFITAYISGTQILFKHPVTDPYTADFKIRSAVIPSKLTEMPKSVVPELSLVVAELAKAQFLQQNRGLDKNVK